MKEFFCNILTMEVLLGITFVFGVLQFLTTTKLFGSYIGYITDVLIPVTLHGNRRGSLRNFVELIKNVWRKLGIWFYYFSLCFQAWYWLFSNNSIFN